MFVCPDHFDIYEEVDLYRKLAPDLSNSKRDGCFVSMPSIRKTLEERTALLDVNVTELALYSEKRGISARAKSIDQD